MVSGLRTTKSTPAATVEDLIHRFMETSRYQEVKKYIKGMNISHHINQVEKLNEASNLSGGEKATLLTNTLDDQCQMELFGMPGYFANSQSFEWVKSTLLKLFGKPHSDFGLLADFMKLHQGTQETTRDFLSRVRVTGYQLMGNEDEDRREQYNVLAFIHGLANRRAAHVVEQLKPATLEEAFAKLQDQSETNVKTEEVNMISNDGERVKLLEKQVLFMMNEIQSLKVELAKLNAMNTSARRHDSSPRNFVQPQGKPPQGPKCYACQEYGHIARFCRKQGRGQLGIKPNRFRLLHDEGDNISEVPTEMFESDSKSQDTVGRAPPAPKGVLSINTKSPRKTQVEKWCDYIEHGTGRPRQPLRKGALSTYTRISSSESESAHNKPIVRSTLLGRQLSVLVDSGAESNVADYQFVQDVMKEDPFIKFVPKNGSLRCANGSPLRIVGFTYLTLKIGSSNIAAKFTVVERIFPRVIVGIKTMKREAIDVIAQHDCISIHGERVPFLSEIDSTPPGETMVTAERRFSDVTAGNGVAQPLRTLRAVQ